MAKVRISLGGRAYLFKDATGYAMNVVISAHGYYLPTTGNLSPGFPTLKFYCQHGGLVKDVQRATRILNTPPAEVVPNGGVVTTTDYLLFKFGEHKSSIEAERARFNTAYPRNQMTFTEMENDMGGAMAGGETYGTFRNVTDINNDYVTVRNRHSAFGGPVISLGSLIALIQAKNAYTEIKCAFCREAKAADFVPNLKADLSDN